MVRNVRLRARESAVWARDLATKQSHVEYFSSIRSTVVPYSLALWKKEEPGEEKETKEYLLLRNVWQDINFTIGAHSQSQSLWKKKQYNKHRQAVGCWSVCWATFDSNTSQQLYRLISFTDVLIGNVIIAFFLVSNSIEILSRSLSLCAIASVNVL